LNFSAFFVEFGDVRSRLFTVNLVRKLNLWDRTGDEPRLWEGRAIHSRQGFLALMSIQLAPAELDGPRLGALAAVAGAMSERSNSLFLERFSIGAGDPAWKAPNHPHLFCNG
jgi:hypothetical protein